MAVVVSYNRRDLLLECLAAVEGQSRPPEAIVVVDNASTDGSAEAVRAKFPDVDVVELVANTGGAGGFAVGMEHARAAHSASLLWIMDDDTIPEPTALEELVRVHQGYRPTPSVVASTVVWTDGQVMGRNKPKVLFERTPWKTRRAAAWDCTPMRYSTFVSILVDTAAHPDLEVIADFFLWGDDTEFSAALIRRAPGLLSRRSVAVHKTPGFGARIEDPGPRFGANPAADDDGRHPVGQQGAGRQGVRPTPGLAAGEAAVRPEVVEDRSDVRSHVGHRSPGVAGGPAGAGPAVGHQPEPALG